MSYSLLTNCMLCSVTAITFSSSRGGGREEGVGGGGGGRVSGGVSSPEELPGPVGCGFTDDGAMGREQ